MWPCRVISANHTDPGSALKLWCVCYSGGHSTKRLISLVHHRIRLSCFDCSWLLHSLSLHFCLSFFITVGLFVCLAQPKCTVYRADTWASKQPMVHFFKYPCNKLDKIVTQSWYLFCFLANGKHSMEPHVHSASSVCIHWDEAWCYSLFYAFKLFKELTSSSWDLIYNTNSAW